MKQFTQHRNEATQDEIWLLSHPPVFTQGQNGKPEHILDLKDIPLIHTDRGGQITYHGPGQLMIYTLIDLQRKKLNVREFVTILEQAVISFLATYQISAYAKCAAPGIYINEQKIGSIGLRVKRACTYHGIALNVNMDLTPFTCINPCGFAQLQMTQLTAFINLQNLQAIGYQLSQHLIKSLAYTAADYVAFPY